MAKKSIILGTMLLMGQSGIVNAFASNVPEVYTNSIITGIEFLSDQMEKQKACYEFSIEYDDKIDGTSIIEEVSECAQEKGYIPADYALKSENQIIMFWSLTDEDQILSCMVHNQEAETKVNLLLQYCKIEDMMHQDFSKIPFDLDYGATKDQTEEALSHYAWRYDPIEETGAMDRGCYTVFIPELDGIQYIQLYSISMDSMQFLEPYAEAGFSFSQENLLARAVYHLSSEYDTERCINEVKPELTTSWKTISGQGESWICEHTAEEVLKDSSIFLSQLWKDIGSLYRVYYISKICLDEEGDLEHFDIVYDGSKGLVLQTVAQWKLISAQ